MESENVVSEKIGQVLRVCCRLAWDEVGHFGESVHNNQNGPEIPGERQVGDEVHGDRIPSLLRNSQGLELTIRSMSGRLASLTSVTVVDEPDNVLSHLGPVEVSGEEFKGGSSSWMASSHGRMSGGDDFLSEVLIIWNIEKAMNVEKSITC